jgi:hypothetical protein
MMYHIHGTTKTENRWIRVQAVDCNEAEEKAKKILGNDYFIVSVQNFEPKYDSENCH